MAQTGSEYGGVPRRAGSMKPDELAHAAVMAALGAATAIIAVVVPFAAGLSALGTVPMGLLAYRHRLRVLVAATVAGGTIAFLIAGFGGLMTVVNGAYIGGLMGIVKRRGRGTATILITSVLAGAVFGVLGIGFLLLFHRIRELIFASTTANVNGLAAVADYLSRMEAFSSLASVARHLRTDFPHVLSYWPVLIFGASILSITSVALVGWWALSRVLTRLAGVPDVHKLDYVDPTEPVAPVPVRFADVRFRYDGAQRDALGPVSLAIGAGEHVAITGPNGSGKTTLMLLLSGRPPTAGTVERPGAVGLGATGGTAVVMQHPESQVLGTRVADDVVFGLPPGAGVDVDRLLAEVGLDGLAERDTGGLSGGELQRLAVAAALAREPSLLIADEVTSMVDQQGREALISVLSELSANRRMSLVHITHFTDEASSADRVIDLVGGGSADNVEMVSTAPAPAATTPLAPRAGSPLLELKGVGHEYGVGSPWASTALRDVDLVVNEGDGVLIHGTNGSGKSTLAWIMAGLLTPTTGECLLDGAPVTDQVGAVAISFQAARLQLMRSRVDMEIAAAAGLDYFDHGQIVAALAMVGLDPAIGLRRIDQLSGGQMRRVVLAGLLARKPRVLILDEPLAGLDAASQRGLLGLLAALRRDAGLTVVVISHDFSGLEELCPRTLHLRDGAVMPAPTAAEGVG
ncbi:cobalt ABC transporter ATP-binding protein [Mycolicibacterium madagascariense]|uniref:Cobalt ABC transporter ATP-binding protein n=1 Tax=Mycolicibacterium madagascariense TaxID=212765 RepID=A0A7I7XJE3_9MYCO|nr:ABC transporter ATP-binding protein [Mycolicibacterium madagascariense]MCV7015858.1 ATP-binding cassette domain-containing protein [Mycolicibacterium madagascariense]BBZ29332.1 cobalt ABC transporter ATP-binding protein [Mycolicibacterium madagascariense]